MLYILFQIDNYKLKVKTPLEVMMNLLAPQTIPKLKFHTCRKEFIIIILFFFSLFQA